MKILILYTARSGTNSIASYFLKQNPTYEYFNQPFTRYVEDGIRHSTYNKCINFDNVLVKSEISNFEEINVSKEQILLDFDKVLLISRKNKKDQAISYIIANTAKNFLDKRKRGYYIEMVDDKVLNSVEEYKTGQHNKLIKLMDSSFRFFYYEDLYYGDFSELFEYLGIKFIQSDFDDILDIKNKYRYKDLVSKTIKTLT
jgi:hypothetical protein